jgi:transcriptional regulator
MNTPYTVKTQAEVAKALGITQHEVSMAERKALRKLWYQLKEVARAAGFRIQPPVALAKQPHLGRKKRSK